VWGETVLNGDVLYSHNVVWGNNVVWARTLSGATRHLGLEHCLGNNVSGRAPVWGNRYSGSALAARTSSGANTLSGAQNRLGVSWPHERCLGTKVGLNVIWGTPFGQPDHLGPDLEHPSGQQHPLGTRTSSGVRTSSGREHPLGDDVVWGEASRGARPSRPGDEVWSDILRALHPDPGRHLMERMPSPQLNLDRFASSLPVTCPRRRYR